MAAERFMNNDHIELADLLEELTAGCAAQEVDHALVLQDTSQYKFDTFKDRFKADDPHIGVLADNYTLGIYAHTALALNAANGLPIGLTDLQCYHLDRDRLSRQERGYKLQPIEDKRSYRWIQTIIDTARRLPKARKLTVIADREADIYQLLSHPYDQRVELVIRSSFNRKLPQGPCLHEHLEGLPWMHRYSIVLPHDRERPTGSVDLAVRWSTVCVAKPSSVIDPQGRYPKEHQLQIIEVLEQAPRPAYPPIHWYLLTTHPVKTGEDARQIIQWYVQRWWIEEFFRLTKKKGFEMEKSNLRSGIALKRLMHLVFAQAVKVMALRQGRQQDTVPAQQLFGPMEIALLERVAQQVQGQSTYQQNPFPSHSLAWASWIIARLGGWTARPMNKRPPGVVSFIRGYRRFQDFLQGFAILYDPPPD